MSLWIFRIYESNLATAKSVIATFFKVFPNGILFSNDIRGEGYDAVLFGVNQPDAVKIDLDAVQKLLERPEYARVRGSLDRRRLSARAAWTAAKAMPAASSPT